VKTGRLLKFHRKDADIQAYLYQDGAAFKAAIYVLGRQARAANSAADQELAAATAQLVEDEVRAWVDTHFPR
jgi:hypothetical protein